MTLKYHAIYPVGRNREEPQTLNPNTAIASRNVQKRQIGLELGPGGLKLEE